MKVYILLVDDEQAVLEAATRDLEELEDTFPIETADNAKEAERLIEEIHDRGDKVGVIFCDHVMPGGNGVDLLIRLEEKIENRHMRKVLITGQAGLDATIRAVNESRLNQYVAKPWKSEDLVRIAREQLTEFFIASGEDARPYLGQLDSKRMAEAIHRRNIIGDA